MLRGRARREALQRETRSATAAGQAAQVDAGRLAAAIGALPDAVVVVDEKGETVLRNEAGGRYRDARYGDAIVADVVNALLREAVRGEPGERQLDLHGPPPAVLVVKASPLRVEGEISGAVATVHDVSDLRRIESVRRDFVANVSHELKTPIGALALLAETISESTDEEANRQLSERLVREADRLSRIVDDLLDLSLIEGQEGFAREHTPLRILVEEAADRVRPFALSRGIPLVDSPPAEDLVVLCDPTQVLSAITNLLDNAIKYSDPGARVELLAHRWHGRAVVEVRDHGMGIPTKDLERIFERFYRVDKARSRSTGGTGLGLAIVRHVAQVHGGDVTVESVEGEGSTFRFALPLAESSGIAEAS